MEVTGRQLRLERNPEALARARRWIESLTASLPDPLAQDIRLLSHELVTNAVKHSDGEQIWLAALVLPAAIRIEVCDEGGLSQPVMLPHETYASSGRGLLWVNELSDAWGTDQHRRVTSVWFQIDLDDREQVDVAI
jgi:anti-sigma regulatory factor (Ser/Thr protein kinase)